MADSIDDSDPIKMLLLMAMFLIVQRPDEQAGRCPNDNQYFAVRHFYFQNLAEMTARPSIKLLQSGILIATYEYGHGLIESACHTLGPCISAGVTLGLHNVREPYSQSLGLEPNNQREEILLWWAIIVTDRYVCPSVDSMSRDLSFGRILCLSFPPGSRLPLAWAVNESAFLVELQDRSRIGFIDLRSLFGTNFYHQIQSCVLIGEVLRLLSARDPLSEQSQAQFDLLDGHIRCAMHINLETEIKKLGVVSEGLALNRRYLLLRLCRLCLTPS